ncbi:MAG: hydroxymethylglutaryl-CoA reductase, degradative [Chloroflexi bacterium]|nr:hydroxymethylglutaryl-CoA reductase, degradative [Chloroflexota bacterium]
MNAKNSAISQFYRRPMAERRAIAKAWAGLNPEDMSALRNAGLTEAEAELMIENVIGRYSLPFALATNFRINESDYLIPKVIEESSVVAACSFAAKLFRRAGGFSASSDEPVMIGQIQLLDLADLEEAAQLILAHKGKLLAQINEGAGSIVKRGGGALNLEIRKFEGTRIGDMLVIHLHFDTRDAMGANAINSALERIAPSIERISGGRVNLRILSNLSDRRLARASGMIEADTLATEGASGAEVVDAIIEAAALAEIDPYRAATHNKGIMNGIDALMLATGNDWRAAEAGAHAYAARDGQYTSLTTWWKDQDGDLHGRIELPLAAGIVGGATRAHRGAQTALKILGVESARELAEVAAAVGLAQNFAAIRALATDGIQRGHMRMHARQLALAAGATAEAAPDIARQMVDSGNIRLEAAKEIVEQKKRGR